MPKANKGTYPAAEVDRHIEKLTEIIQTQHQQIQVDHQLISEANAQVQATTEILKTYLDQA